MFVLSVFTPVLFIASALRAVRKKPCVHENRKEN